MEIKNILGIDVGTTGIKAVVFDQFGNTLDTEYSEYETFFPNPDWVEQDPNTWWNVLKNVLHKLFLRVQAKNVCAIGVTGQIASVVALDKDDSVLCNSFIWMDKRAVEECQFLEEKMTADALYNIIGTRPNVMFVIYKLMWLKKHQPEVFEKIDTVLQPKDYINFKLTGVKASDYTCAAIIHAFRLKELIWYQEAFDAAGISPEIMPTICSADEVIGYVTDELMAEFGFSAQTPVVACGSDTTVAALGCGMINRGDAGLVIGTSSDVMAISDTVALDSMQQFGCYPYLYSGKYMMIAGGNSGGVALKWYRDTFFSYEKAEADKTGESIYDNMLAPIENIPIGSEGLIFLPYMSGERSPVYNPNARGMFVGMGLSHTKEHFTRAIVEGISLSLMDRIIIAENAGVEIDKIIVAGGGSKNDIWRQMLTDMIGKPTLVSKTEEATSLGAAMMAAAGAGIYPSVEEACKNMSSTCNEMQPNSENKERYALLYKLYKEAYQCNADYFDHLSALRKS